MKHTIQGVRYHTMTLSTTDLVALLNLAGSVFPDWPKGGLTLYPDGVRVTVTVPSGGDYSGDSLDLDEVGGLTLCWQEKL
jgi:hypothetical protein